MEDFCNDGDVQDEWCCGDADSQAEREPSYENLGFETDNDVDETATGELVDRIQRGDWPIEMPFVLEQVGHSPTLRSRLVPSDWPKLPNEIARGTMHWGRARTSDWWFEHAEARIKDGASPLRLFFLLCFIDPQRYLQATAQYLARALSTAQPNPADLRDLPAVVSLVHEVDAQLIPSLVDQTDALCKPAGRRLREIIVDLTCDPFFADGMGLLSAAALRERLEDP